MKYHLYIYGLYILNISADLIKFHIKTPTNTHTYRYSKPYNSVVVQISLPSILNIISAVLQHVSAEPAITDYSRHRHGVNNKNLDRNLLK